jgi:2,5-dioxopentanoate dehydrogenase
MTATMPDTHLTGQMLIAGEPVRASCRAIHAFDPSAGRKREPAYGDSSDVNAACAAAAAAFADYRSTTAEQRAQFLETIAGVLREGSWNEARIDPALPDRTPLPRPDIRQRSVPLGRLTRGEPLRNVVHGG